MIYLNIYIYIYEYTSTVNTVYNMFAENHIGFLLIDCSYMNIYVQFEVLYICGENERKSHIQSQNALKLTF